MSGHAIGAKVPGENPRAGFSLKIYLTMVLYFNNFILKINAWMNTKKVLFRVAFGLFLFVEYKFL